MGRVLVSGGLICYLITLIDIRQFCFILGGTRLDYLIIAPFLILFSFIFAALRWQLTLFEFGILRKIHQLFNYYIVGSLYSMVLPGGVGGDIVRVAMCAEGTNTLAVAISSLLERACGVAALLMIAASVVFFLPSSIPQNVSFPLLHLLPAMVLFLAVLGTLSVVIIRRCGAIFNVESCQKKWLRRVVQLVVLLSRIKARVFLLLIVFSILFQATGILADYFLAKALHIPLSLSYFFLVSSAVFIASILPVSLGGLGVREGMLVYFLSAAGVTSSEAIALSLLMYCNRIVVSCLGAFCLSFMMGRVGLVRNIK
jgi:uncharacterized protein (TIRG00374 family)